MQVLQDMKHKCHGTLQRSITLRTGHTSVTISVTGHDTNVTGHDTRVTRHDTQMSQEMTQKCLSVTGWNQKAKPLPSREPYVCATLPYIWLRLCIPLHPVSFAPRVRLRLAKKQCKRLRHIEPKNMPKRLSAGIALKVCSCLQV